MEEVNPKPNEQQEAVKNEEIKRDKPTIQKDEILIDGKNLGKRGKLMDDIIS